MNKRLKTELLVIGTITALIVGLVLVQAGIARGRALAAPSVSIQAYNQTLIDGLQRQLNEARFDAEVERQKLSIILCESDGKHVGTWGDGGRSYGIAQFQRATFNDLRKEAGRPDLRWKNRDDQLWLLDWALRHGYGDRWTCFKKATPRTTAATPRITEAKR
jgi:hypothetical protein